MRAGKKRNPFLRFFLECKESWPGWCILLGLSFLSGWFVTRIAGLTGEMIDLGAEGRFSEMKSVGTGLVIVLLCNCVRTFLHYFINARTSECMFRKARTRMFEALTEGKLSFIEGKFPTGEVVSRLNNDIGGLCEIFSGQVTWYLRVLMEAAVALAVCLHISVSLTLIYMLVMPVSVWLITRMSKTLQARQKQAAAYTGDAASVVSEVLNHIMTVKAFHMEERMSGRYEKELASAKEQEKKLQATQACMRGIRYAAQIVQLLVLFIASLMLVGRGMLTAGSAITFLAICTCIREALELSDRMISNWHKGTALAERIYEVLDIPMSGRKIVPLDTQREEQLLLENVAFSYRTGKKVLDGINLHVHRGQKVGVVGPSGCGKSTLIKLICKFYDTDSGKLLLFGEPVEGLSEASVYSRVSMVGQEPCLFTGTIFENAANGKEGATRQEVEAVLRRVQLWDYVFSLKDGMDTHIGEGGGQLSGGQAQRLSIARAMLKDAELVLLDEPTSALDAKTEYELREAFRELLSGKTAVIVSHRYGVIEDADYIYCLGTNGRIVEEGTPQELLSRDGYYRSMYLAQQNG